MLGVRLLGANANRDYAGGMNLDWEARDPVAKYVAPKQRPNSRAYMKQSCIATRLVDYRLLCLISRQRHEEYLESTTYVFSLQQLLLVSIE